MPVIIQLAAAAAGAGDHGESASGGLPQMDFSTYPSQIFWLAVTFGTLYWVMSSVILPRLSGAIEERRDRIADDHDAAADFRRQAEEAERDYNQALADARAKAQAIAAETRATVEAEIAEMQAMAEERAGADVAAAEARLEDMKRSAAESVRVAAADAAKEIVASLIDETPTDEAVAAAVSRIQG